MRSHGLLFVTLLALAACTTKEARRPDTTAPATATLAGSLAPDFATVRRAIDSTNAHFVTAVLKGDSIAAAESYASDVIVMPPNAKVRKGQDAELKNLGAMASSRTVTGFSLRTIDLLTAGDYAVETGRYDMTMQPKAGKPEHDVGKYLTVWKKELDGSYKIIRDIYNSDLPAK